MEKSQNFAIALRELRNSKGITLDQISDSTKIKIKYLEKMENGDFSFKSDVYIKLFLKEYLKCIDIHKSDSILQEYNSMFSSTQDIDLTFIPDNQNEEEVIETSTLSHDYDPKKIGIIILVLITIIAVYQFFEYKKHIFYSL